MNLHRACSRILSQLSFLIHQIKEEDFSKPCETLNGSTIGQHLRHTLEFFLCLEKGFEQGLINYDRRAHDKLLEQDKFIAIAVIDRISNFVENGMAERPLFLEVGYDLAREDFVTIETNVMRELVYNIEHAVHHMAIIKIGLKEVGSYIQLPNDFGVAASTIRYQEVLKTSN